MGRPVQKRQFGDPAATAGNQLFMFGDIGAGTEQVFVVSQRSTRIFLVESVSSGNQGEILLVNGPSAVSGTGFGYLEAGVAGGNFEVDSITSIAAIGVTYDVGDDVDLTGTGTDATMTVALVTPVNAQDEGDYAVSFSGGAGHNNGDVITMTDGTTVLVDLEAGNVVTQFTVDSTGATGGLASNVTLAQASTTGGGINFDLTLVDANQGIFSVTLVTGGDYSVDLTNPVVSSSAQAGTGAIFNVVTSSTSNVYVFLLSNKNLKTFGQVGGRQSYLINDDGATINIPGA